MVVKPPKPRKCKVCKEPYYPRSTTQKVCGFECSLILARQNGSKAAEKVRKKETRLAKERLKTRSEWLKQAQRACNAYIRERDKDLPCISCGRSDAVQWHAGHYRSVGACPELRFVENNIHKQCSQCNDWKSGSIVEYRINLIKRIGQHNVDFLEGPHGPNKYDIPRIKEIEAKYKEKTKLLKAGVDFNTIFLMTK